MPSRLPKAGMLLVAPLRFFSAARKFPQTKSLLPGQHLTPTGNADGPLARVGVPADAGCATQRSLRSRLVATICSCADSISYTGSISPVHGNADGPLARKGANF